MDSPREYKTHRPSGQKAPPLVLLEGGEKTGKSYKAAEFTGSDRLSRSFWIEFGEVTAEEYGKVPGANYEIVEWDGTYADLYGAIQWVHGRAQAARAAGEKPVSLTIDTMSAEWELLRGWVNNRARAARFNREKLEADPDAEIVIFPNLWNDANDRDSAIMRLLMTFPGIVIMICRGKKVAAFDEATGRPIEGRTDYRVEGNKLIASRASCWVRLSLDEPPKLIGCRKVPGGIVPGVNKPKTLKKTWTLEQVIFEELGYDPEASQVPNLVSPKPERPPEDIAADALAPGASLSRLCELWEEGRRSRYGSVTVSNENGQEELLPHLLKRKIDEHKGVRVSAAQIQRMEALWPKVPLSDAGERASFVREVVGRPVNGPNDLTGAEMEQLIARLDAWAQQETPPQAGHEPDGSPDGEKPPAEPGGGDVGPGEDALDEDDLDDGDRYTAPWTAA
ncbi:hypothetical protein [Actinomadura sp. K4S16]|uniref:hypothetical protein n=1 Tax=Actinomadura sp. K4S16 TaxID=1316147 RepID=UPI0011EDC326|nr:hypothetical protein [Actinomadura sp. K4S16]